MNNRGPGNFRPDTVLRRSAELLAVNKPQEALQSISEVFASKRFRSTPLVSLEPIMLKFLELCVDLKKGRPAKEGLHMYKNVAQNTSVVSVETVINAFLARSRDKLAEALAKVDEIEGPTPAQVQPSDIAEVEDLEASETPESILLSAVSDEKSRDRTYRTVVTPWLRFLWEAYRTSLDILRNNARLENLYQQIAHEAFDFCLTHTRKTEFRRLCETLRSHLASSQKYSHQSHSINLSEPETLQRHLDTRFHQLNTAVELELWQEAFRTAEDIHGLVGMSKRAPKASMMATYFEKLVKVFAVGNNFLFHAAAYGKYYTQLNIKDEGEAAKAASLVLLSALAVPVTAEAHQRRRDGSVEETDSQKSKASRLATLLGLSSTPTRTELLKDALSRGVLRRVSPELRALYNILEVDFHPLSITKKIDPILTSLAQGEFARYVEPLKGVVLSRLFNQLGQVYDSLSLERAIQLSSFASEQETPLKARTRIEKFIAGACRRGELLVNFDHAAASISFQQDPFDPTQGASSEAGSLQPSPSLLLQTQLSRLGLCLLAAVDLIDPENSAQGQALKQHAAAVQAMSTKLGAEREILLSRQGIIEKRKKQTEEILAKRDKEDAAARQAALQAKAEEAARREREEIIKRERERMRKQAEQMKLEEAKALAKQLAQQRGIKVAIDDLSGVDTTAIVKMSVDAIEKEKKDLAEKIRIVGKRMDHLERAQRKEERPLLAEDYKRQIDTDRTAFETNAANKLREAKERHEQDLIAKNRLSAFLSEYRTFRASKETDAIAANKRAEEESQRKIAEEKAKRRQQIRERREAELQRQLEEEQARKEAEEREAAEREEREREAAERRAREEAEAQEAEERRRKEAEEAAALRQQRLAEREARNKELDAQAARQREKEAEIERKLQAKKAGLPYSPAATSAAATAAVPGAAAWRRAEVPPAAEAAAPSLEGRRPLFGQPKAGGWRERMAARETEQPSGGAKPDENTRPSAPSTTPGESPDTLRESVVNSLPAAFSRPAPPPANAKPEEDGFQTVPAKGRYVPPSRRGQPDTGRAGGRW